MREPILIILFEIGFRTNFNRKMHPGKIGGFIFRFSGCISQKAGCIFWRVGCIPENRGAFWGDRVHYSRIFPSREIVTTCQGMNLPLLRSAVSASRCSPPQQGTSIRTMVTLLMSLSRMIAVNFSAASGNQ